MSPSNCSPIQIRCPMCPNEHPIESPEELCGHMAQCHDVQTTMQSKCFESFAHFQIWLSHIEDSRCDGGYLGSSQGPSYEDEYYLLCRRRPSAPTKRRRLSDDSCNLEAASAVVACTAFVHVFETMDGRVTVRYCLDHCGHSTDGEEHKNTETAQFRGRSTLKRTSPCATFEICDELCECEQSSSSMASSPTSSVDFEDEDSSNNNYKVPPVDPFSVSSLIINQRLDTTADRLRVLTKVLQDLAVDIRNTDYPIAI